MGERSNWPSFSWEIATKEWAGTKEEKRRSERGQNGIKGGDKNEAVSLPSKKKIAVSLGHKNASAVRRSMTIPSSRELNAKFRLRWKKFRRKKTSVDAFPSFSLSANITHGWIWNVGGRIVVVLLPGEGILLGLQKFNRRDTCQSFPSRLYPSARPNFRDVFSSQS